MAKLSVRAALLWVPLQASSVATVASGLSSAVLRLVAVVVRWLVAMRRMQRLKLVASHKDKQWLMTRM
jgi:hypothetical protein